MVLTTREAVQSLWITYPDFYVDLSGDEPGEADYWPYYATYQLCADSQVHVQVTIFVESMPEGEFPLRLTVRNCTTQREHDHEVVRVSPEVGKIDFVAYCGNYMWIYPTI